MTRRTLITACLLLGVGSVVLAARQGTTSPFVLPESAQLSDVVVQWQNGGGDGCGRVGGCTNYRITIRGDGLLTLEDLGWGMEPPKAAPRQRTLPVDVAILAMLRLKNGGAARI